jgi:hypothetical protein
MSANKNVNAFLNDTNLVGGIGTKYNQANAKVEYACIDTEENNGYFTDILDKAVEIEAISDEENQDDLEVTESTESVETSAISEVENDVNNADELQVENSEENQIGIENVIDVPIVAEISENEDNGNIVDEQETVENVEEKEDNVAEIEEKNDNLEAENVEFSEENDFVTQM